MAGVRSGAISSQQAVPLRQRLRRLTRFESSAVTGQEGGKS
jgi:hypothetical protein